MLGRITGSLPCFWVGELLAQPGRGLLEPSKRGNSKLSFGFCPTAPSEALLAKFPPFLLLCSDSGLWGVDISSQAERPNQAEPGVRYHT